MQYISKEFMMMPFNRYRDFDGRSRRQEFWNFLLVQVVAWIAVSILGSVLSVIPGVGGILSALLNLAFLVVFVVPGIAVQIRRFHDLDKSGWYCLINLVPVVGFLAVLYFMSLEGTSGSNQFGDDPKSGSATAFE